MAKSPFALLSVAPVAGSIRHALSVGPWHIGHLLAPAGLAKAKACVQKDPNAVHRLQIAVNGAGPMVVLDRSITTVLALRPRRRGRPMWLSIMAPFTFAREGVRLTVWTETRTLRSLYDPGLADAKAYRDWFWSEANPRQLANVWMPPDDPRRTEIDIEKEDPRIEEVVAATIAELGDVGTDISLLIHPPRWPGDEAEVIVNLDDGGQTTFTTGSVPGRLMHALGLYARFPLGTSEDFSAGTMMARDSIYRHVGTLSAQELGRLRRKAATACERLHAQ